MVGRCLMLDTMTSWFSVGDALTRVAVMVCVVCVTGGQLGAVQGTTYIPQCSADGWLEARENQSAATFLTCEGFRPNQDVSWQLMKNVAVQASSTCGPPSTLHGGDQCDTTTSDIVVQRTSDTITSLLISNNRRELVGNGSVRCLAEDVTNFGSCKINVITTAVLSDCEVTVTTNQTLTGSCNFRNAYASNGTYTCTWTLTPTDRQGDPNVIFPGVIHKTPYMESSKLYYNGTCSLNLTSSELPPGDYSYTVRFFPGDSDSQHQGIVTVTETITSNPEGVPLGPLIEGIVAAVFAIAAIVAVIVIWRKGWAKKSFQLKQFGHEYDKCGSNDELPYKHSDLS